MQDLYDESMHHLQEIKREAEQALRFFERLEHMFKKNAENLPSETALTGNITDIVNCESGLSKTAIDSLPSETKEQLLKNLEHAEKQGLISIDFENKKVLLTDKGKEFIEKAEFQRQLGADISKLKNAEVSQYGAELTGTDRDLLFFKDNEILDLKSINFANADKESVIKFSENLKSLHERGLIKLEKDMKISLTDKGKNMLKSAEFTEKFGNNLSEKALSALSQGKLIVITKQIAAAVQNSVKAGKAAAEMGG